MVQQRQAMHEYPLLDPEEGIPLFYPHVPEGALEELRDTLSGRWIGQGPKVEEFEQLFKRKFLGEHQAVAVGSGTDALHLAYLLANVEKDDEVIVPVFTCTATNLPLLYIGAKPVFADIDLDTMNVNVEDVAKKITKKTKAIVCVDYGGVPCKYDELNQLCAKNGLKLISDAAHSLGTKYKGKYSAQCADFTIFSFQAIKTLTTADGGLVAIKDKKLEEKAKRLRWFGIDRSAKQKGIWENDIKELGYKYQMNDIAACIGLAGLREMDQILTHRKKLFDLYVKNISNPKLRVVGKDCDGHSEISPWIITVIVNGDRYKLMHDLRENGIESAQVHYRNDRYSIFGTLDSSLVNMNELEEKYLVLPLHTKMTEDHVMKICEVLNSFS